MLILYLAVWTEIYVKMCSTELLGKITEVKSAETPQIRAMIKHPDDQNSVLATLVNDSLAAIDLKSLSTTILSNGTGKANIGKLRESTFNQPINIVEISHKIYAVSDKGNDCVRKLEWQDQTVSFLTGGRRLFTKSCQL